MEESSKFVTSSYGKKFSWHGFESIKCLTIEENKKLHPLCSNRLFGRGSQPEDVWFRRRMALKREELKVSDEAAPKPSIRKIRIIVNYDSFKATLQSKSRNMELAKSIMRPCDHTGIQLGLC